MKKGVVYYLTLVILAIILLMQLFVCGTFFIIFLTPEDFCLMTTGLALLGLIISGVSFLLLKWAKDEKVIKKILSILCSIILLCVMVIFDIFIIFIYAFESMHEIKPIRSRYSLNIHKMSSREHRIKHFPDNIPENAKDYYFLIGESDFHGDQISYLRFVADENFIKSTIEKNKNNIFQKIKFNDICKYYGYIDNGFGVKEEDKNNTWVYIMKHENDDTHYTSGFITTDSNQIIFFFSNFNLKNFGEW